MISSPFAPTSSKSMTARPSSLRDRKIVLSDEEHQLFDIIVKSLNAKGRETVPRVAGGWVRDKLLERNSSDIDIALDDQSGVEFAYLVNDYLRSQGQQTRAVAVIQANPDQSKHLETANIAILNFVIDCVNLRAETYTERSRIPEMRFGTPVEDALRRDFTINALFYNLKTKEVEDFTDRGIMDLEEGIIRTPLPPLETFTDDPLRVFRAVRFASRFNFRVADDLNSTASNPMIHTAILQKVSRERILKEIDGMMNNQGHPFVAFFMMYRFNLFDTILLVENFVPRLEFVNDIPSLFPFYDQANPLFFTKIWKEISMETIKWLSVLLVIESQGKWSLQASDYESIISNIKSEKLADETATISQRDIEGITGSNRLMKMHYTALAVGIRPYVVIEKKKKIPFVSVLLRDSLKLDTDTIRFAQMVADTIPKFFVYSRDHTFFAAQSTSVGTPFTSSTTDVARLIREQAGMLIRECKEHWKDALYLSCAYELAISSIARQTAPTEVSKQSSEDSIQLQIQDVTISANSIEIIQRYQCLQHLWANILDLENVYETKPIFDGTELIALIPLLKKGPLVGKIMDEQVRWMLRHPEGGKENLISFLQSTLQKTMI